MGESVINCVKEAAKLGLVVCDEFSEGVLTKRLVAIMKTVARRLGFKLHTILITKEYDGDWSTQDYLKIFNINVDKALYSINEEVRECGINDERNFVLGIGNIVYEDAGKMPFILGVL